MYRQRNRFKRNFSIDHGAYVVVAIDTRNNITDVVAIELKKDDAQSVVFEGYNQNPERNYIIRKWEK